MFVKSFIDIADSPLNSLVCSLADLARARNGDLSSFAIIIPTRSAARSIKFSLLEKLNSFGLNSILGLEIFTPESFLARFIGDLNVANIFESNSAWIDVLMSLKNSDVKNLFPREIPPRSDFPALAQTLSNLRRSLAEVGLNISSAAKSDEISSSFDSAKWLELAAIEKSYLERLSSIGKIAAEDAAIESLKNFSAQNNPFSDLKDLWLVGISDASRLFFSIISALENFGTSVELKIFSDRIHHSYFDEFGLPNSQWEQDVSLISDSDIFVVADIREQSDFIAKIFSSYSGGQSSIMGIACNEADSVAQLRDAIARVGGDAYSPAGKPLSQDPRIDFLRAFNDYVPTGQLADFSRLMRNPLMLLRIEKDLKMTSAEVLKKFDKFVSDKFPPTLFAAYELSKADSCERALFEYLYNFFDKGIIAQTSVLAALEKLFNVFFKDLPEACLSSDSSCLKGLQMVDDFLRDSLKNLAAAESSELSALSLDETLRLICVSAQRLSAPEQKTVASVPLLDWLEIFWSPQAHLILADMNAGIVPRSDFSDIFLTDSMRARLGISNSVQRRRRDAYMLYVMAKSREGWGKVTVLVPRKRADSSPAQASRLLLQCEDSQLPARVKKLFAEKNFDEPPAPFRASWKLRVPFAPLPSSLSPSAFKSYMECPFRFYLKYVLKLEIFDESVQELDAAGFGSLIHSVFENFANSSSRHESEPEQVEKVFVDILHKTFYGIYGGQLSAPLIFQRESAAQMLRGAACAQALQAGDWEIVESESKKFVDIDGFKISMRIDRIDKNENGDLMIIDYKTYDSLSEKYGMSPVEAAHRKYKIDEETGEKFLEWTDLQLPLYRYALRKDYPDAKISCAYFVVSRIPQESGIYVWDMDDETMFSAVDKARELIEKIRSRDFQPTDEKLYFDDWKDFFSFSDGDLKPYLEFEKEGK